MLSNEQDGGNKFLHSTFAVTTKCRHSTNYSLRQLDTALSKLEDKCSRLKLYVIVDVMSNSQYSAFMHALPQRWV